MRKLIWAWLWVIAAACSSSPSGFDGSADGRSTGGDSRDGTLSIDTVGVINGSVDGRSTGGGGTDGELSTDAPGVTDARRANPIAMLASAIPAGTDTTFYPGLATLSDRQAEVEALYPTTLLLFATSMPEQCTKPTFNFGQSDHKLLVVGLAKAAQAVGIYQFSGTDVIGIESNWLGDGQGNGGGGTGPVSRGQIEVTAIDATSVAAVISGVGAEDGTYHFDICP